MNLIRAIFRSTLVTGLRLVVVLLGVTGLLATLGVAAQAYSGCAVSFDGCGEQHCEPLLSR